MRLLLLLLLAFLTLSSCASAGVIDDFDVPIKVDLQSSNPATYTDTGVGDLGFHRVLVAQELGVDIFGTAEAADGAFMITGDRAVKVLDDIQSHTVSLRYRLPSADTFDATMGGVYDAVAVDLNHALANHQVGTISVSGRSNGSTFTSRFAPVLMGDTPQTLVFPFEEFSVTRGDGDFDPTDAFRLRITFRLLTAGFPEDLDASISVDRIRLTRVVPEPSTIYLVGLCLGLFHRKGLSRCIEGLRSLCCP